MARLLLAALQPGHNYYMQFRASDGNSVSEWSNRFLLSTTSDVTPPDIPAWAVSSPWVVSGDTFVATWQPLNFTLDQNKDFDHYELTLSNGTATVTIRTTNTSYTLTFDQNRIFFGTAAPTVTAQIRAVDAVGNASAYNATTQTATNPAPSNVASVTVTPLYDSIQVDWPIVSDIDLIGYRVDLSITSSSSGYSPVYAGPNHTYTYPTTLYATSHWFRVYAVDKFGTVSASPVTSGAVSPKNADLVDVTAPNTPTSLTATLANNPLGLDSKATLTWVMTSPPSDLAGYNVRYKKSTDSVWSSANFTNDALGGVIDLPVAYTQYDFQIRAFDWHNNVSAWSATATGAAVANSAPTTLTGLAVTANATNGTGFVATWTASSDTDFQQYEIGVKNGATEVFYRLTGTRFDFSLDANRVAFGTAQAVVAFRVRAIDTAGLAGTFTTPVTGTIAAPAAPTTMTSTVGANSINVNWVKSTTPGIVGYNVYQGTSPSPSTFVSLQMDTTYTAIVPSTTGQYFQIKALDVFGQESTGLTGGPFTATAPFIVDVTAPGVPTSVAGTITTNASASQTFMDVSWTPPGDPDLKGFKVRYKKSGDTAYSFVDVAASPQRIYGLVPYVNYLVGVASYDQMNNLSAYSADVTATGATNTAPPTPQAPTAAANTLQVQVTVTGLDSTTAAMPADVAYYEVYASNTSSAFTAAAANMIGVIPVGPAMIDAFQLPASSSTPAATTETWYVKVIAVDNGGLKSAASAAVTSTPGLISTTNIVDASITNAKIGSVVADKITAGLGIINNLAVRSTLTIGDATTTGSIQSFDYSAGTAGFKLASVAGVASLEINKGAISAAALLIQNSENIMPYDMATIEFPSAYYLTNATTGNNLTITPSTSLTASIDVATVKYGLQSLKLVQASTTANEIKFAKASTNNIIIPQSGNYIVSFWINPSVTNAVTIKTYNGVTNLTSTATAALTASTWQRISTVANITTAGAYVSILLPGIAGTWYIDGIQVEYQMSGATAPSPWTIPSVTAIDGSMIKTGAIISNNTITVNAVAYPAWSIDMAGTASVANLLVRGDTVVGDTSAQTGTSIRSATYTGGSAGWKIGADGSAEFNNVIVRGNLQGNSSSVITGGAISGGTVTGATLQTSATANTGIKITTSGLDAYNGTVSKFNIDATTGNVTLSGNLTVNTGGTTTLGGTLVVSGATTLNSTLTVSSGNITGGGWTLASTGMTIPNGAISASKLLLQTGENMIHPAIADFEWAPSYYDPTVAVPNTVVLASTIVLSTTDFKFGAQSLQVTTTATTNYVAFENNITTKFTRLQGLVPSTSYIVSFYAMIKTGGVAATITPTLRAQKSGGFDDVSSGVAVPANSTWARYSMVLTTTANATGAGSLWFQSNQIGTYYIDAIQVEPQVTNSTSPSPWGPPGSTTIDGGMITTGSIQSNTTLTLGAITLPNWSINTTGAAQFGSLTIRGGAIVGADVTEGASSYIGSYLYDPTGTLTGTPTGWRVNSDGTGNFVDLTLGGFLRASNATLSGTLNVGGSISTNGLMGEQINMDNAGFHVWSPYTVSLNNVVSTTNTVTATATQNHGFVIGNKLVISGVGLSCDGTWTVASTPSLTTFTFVTTASGTFGSTAVIGQAQSFSTDPGVQRTKLIDFPTDGTNPNIISGNLTADTLTVNNGAVFGGASTLPLSSALTISARILAPVNAPTITTNYNDNMTSGITTTPYGICKDSTGLKYLVVSSDGNSSYLQQVTITTGIAASPTITINKSIFGGTVAKDIFKGVVYDSVNGRYHVLSLNYGGQGTLYGRRHTIYTYNTSFTLLNQYVVNFEGYNTTTWVGQTLGYDYVNSQLLLCYCDTTTLKVIPITQSSQVPNVAGGGAIVLPTGNGTTINVTSAGSNGLTDPGFVMRIGALDGVTADEFYFKNRAYGTTAWTQQYLPYNNTATTNQTNQQWRAAYGSTESGAYYDSTAGKIYAIKSDRVVEYQTNDAYWSSDANQTHQRWVGYSWYQVANAYETDLSPRASVTFTKRSQSVVSISAIPKSGTGTPDSARVYMAENATQPSLVTGSVSTLWHLRPTITYPSQTGVIVSQASPSGAQPNGTGTNTFAGGTVASIKSSDGTSIVLSGDGTYKLGEQVSGAWVPYTPTLYCSTGSPTYGNSTSTCKYKYIADKTIQYTGVVTLGSTANVGTATVFGFSMPVAPLLTSGAQYVGASLLLDSASGTPGYRPGICFIFDLNAVYFIVADNAAGAATSGKFDGTGQPWAQSGDIIRWSIIYETA